MPETAPQGNAITAIWNSEKGLITVLVLIAATVLCALGPMAIGQWTSFTEVVLSVYVGGKTITTVGTALAERPAKAAEPAPAPVVSVDASTNNAPIVGGA